MGGGQLVLPVGPGLVQLRERGPGGRPPGRLGLRQRAGPGGERLVQPQIVPPAHGDQVTEPHVRHLVQDRLGARLAGEVGDARPEDVGLHERHAARVLHRAFLELGHEELVVLAERVLDAERAVEEVEALPGHLEDLVGVEVGGQRLAAEHAERDAVVLVADHVVRAGRDRGDVGGHDRSGREVPAHRLDVADARRWRRRFSRHVRHDLPVRRGGDGQLVGGLHVRLVEACVDPVRVESLQVRVQVDAPVGGVGEPVQPLAAVRVGACGRYPEHVVGGQPGQRDPVAVERVQADRLVVQGDLVDRGRGQVNKRGRPGRRAGEPDHADRAECLLVAGQVEVHLV